MKTILTTLMIVTMSALTYGQNKLQVKITNLKTNEGSVMIKLMNKDKSTFKAIKGTVKDKVCTVSFNEIPSGTYAITYYHDENDNGKLDTGMFGKPEEGYGYSNDARGFMGPADFEDQLFEINSNLEISLKTVQ